MRPGDVIAYENIVCYNTSPNGTRGEELSSSGYRWDYGKGWEGLGGYNAKSAEKLASTVLLPAVLEAIRTHKENPKDMTPPTLTKASYLPPRPTLPLVFPPTRPKQAGKVISWGGQQTGVAAPQPKLIAALTVPEGLRAVQVVTTWDNACIALKPNGTVVAWGDNKNGLNDVPEGLANVVQIAAGNKIAAALKGDGTVVTWGAGAPPPYDSSNVVQIAIADDSLFGLKSDGTLAGRSNDSRFISPTNLVQIVGGAHPIGLTQDGKVVALKNITEKEFYIPENLGEVHSLAQCHDSQARHVSALLVDGTVAAWGRDDSGQATVPKGLKDVVRVSSSNDNTFAILRNGKVEGWGSNWFRQQDFPKELRNAIQVSGGGGVVLGIVKD